MKRVPVQSVRLLVQLLDTTEDEETAIPDPTGAGLRVARKVRCFLDSSDQTQYTLKMAGTAPTVQWLMTSPGDTCFFVTAQVRGSDKAFNVLAYENTNRVGADVYKLLMNKHIEHKGDVEVAHDTDMTPQKRLTVLNVATDDPSTPPPFNKRIKLE